MKTRGILMVAAMAVFILSAASALACNDSGKSACASKKSERKASCDTTKAEPSNEACMAKLKDSDPAEYARLKKLKESDPAAFKAELKAKFKQSCDKVKSKACNSKSGLGSSKDLKP